jgi:hypothetical protein
LGHNAKHGLKKSIVHQWGTKLGNSLQLGMKPILFQIVYLLQTPAHVSFLILDVFFAFKHPTCELVSLLAHFWICKGFGFQAFGLLAFSFKF